MRTPEQRKRGRSPSYPAISLKAAVDRARKLWQEEHEYPTALPTIFKHWGYKSTAGNANLVIAALRKFGLVDYEGTGDTRRAKVSKLAVQILDHPDEATRLGALQKAALTPPIHAELWQKYRTQLPSDDALR